MSKGGNALGDTYYSDLEGTGGEHHAGVKQISSAAFRKGGFREKHHPPSRFLLRIEETAE